MNEREREEAEQAPYPGTGGVEELLAMAAVDDRFAESLAEDRLRAIDASGVSLTAGERRLLEAVDGGTLERMVSRIGSGVPDADRRRFIGRSAAAMLVLVAGAGGCKSCAGPVRGARPDPPAQADSCSGTKQDAGGQRRMAPPTGSRPDPPPGTKPPGKSE